MRGGTCGWLPLVHANGRGAAAARKRGDNKNVAGYVYAGEASLTAARGSDEVLEEPDADIGVSTDRKTLGAKYEEVVRTTRSRTCVGGRVTVCKGVLVRRLGRCKQPSGNIVPVLGATG